PAVITAVSLGTIGTIASSTASRNTIAYAHPEASETSWGKCWNMATVSVVSTPPRNRGTPLGGIVAIPLRGAWTGNRGVLHRGREIVRFHASDLWITCALRFKDRWREQWLPNRFTWLYFHDEAVSLAAGHRPCAECRRESYNAYRDAWGGAP